MKAKLVKLEDGYNLYIEQPLGMLLEATCSISELKRLENNKASIKKLSLKNCQAIECGYDLEEISSSLRKKFEVKYNAGKGIPLRGGGYIVRGLDYQVGVIDGFRKALEILGDKKFSEEDMVKMFFNGRESLDKALVTVQEAKSVIQSLQQTEWGVEIEMDICGDKVYAVPEPVLDENGCLILKRK